MSTYIFQVQTTDFELRLASELTAETVSGLISEAKKMKAKFPQISGLTYLIGFYKKVNEKLVFTLLKKGTIS